MRTVLEINLFEAEGSNPLVEKKTGKVAIGVSPHFVAMLESLFEKRQYFQALVAMRVDSVSSALDYNFTVARRCQDSFVLDIHVNEQKLVKDNHEFLSERVKKFMVTCQEVKTLRSKKGDETIESLGWILNNVIEYNKRPHLSLKKFAQDFLSLGK
jgi:hypothetical protein